MNDELYYIAITVNGEKIEVEVKSTSWITTKNHLGMMKNDVFPQLYKHKSVKKVYELQEKFDKIKELIESNNNLEISDLKEEIENIMK